jgi:hypothetical protein
VDKAWEENWITDEEDWSVVANNIPHAIISVELNGKTAWIASCISAATFTALNFIPLLEL